MNGYGVIALTSHKSVKLDYFSIEWRIARTEDRQLNPAWHRALGYLFSPCFGDRVTKGLSTWHLRSIFLQFTKAAECPGITMPEGTKI
jgi:hypothetical protein